MGPGGRAQSAFSPHSATHSAFSRKFEWNARRKKVEWGQIQKIQKNQCFFIRFRSAFWQEFEWNARGKKWNALTNTAENMECTFGALGPAGCRYTGPWEPGLLGPRWALGRLVLWALGPLGPVSLGHRLPCALVAVRLCRPS